mgnify:CR=1 FL=1|jgi:hypothetical protein
MRGELCTERRSIYSQNTMYKRRYLILAVGELGEMVGELNSAINSPKKAIGPQGLQGIG